MRLQTLVSMPQNVQWALMATTIITINAPLILKVWDSIFLCGQSIYIKPFQGVFHGGSNVHALG